MMLRGLDISTTGAKALVIDPEGNVVSGADANEQYQQLYPTLKPTFQFLSLIDGSS